MIISSGGKQDIAKTGGKSASLMRLASAGFNVPPFLTISTDAFHKAGMDNATRAQLLDAVTKLGSGPYAARSSAMEEDGDAHSHAGQFLSLLNLTKRQLPTACVKVFKSGKQESVTGYRSTRGLEGEGGGTAVLVQQMVDARVAGIAFTADPVSGKRNRIIISAIEGLGDKLVGGEEDGETYILDKSGAVLEKNVEQDILSKSDLDALHQLVLKVEEACGSPQDIEWAFEDDELFLLQARPITTQLRPEPVEDTMLTIFDNSNIVESYPGMISPLTYSFAQYAYARVYRSFIKLLGVNGQKVSDNAAIFDNMLARLDGRIYYNLINWYKALALLPGFSINSAHMETMMGVDEPMPVEITDNLAPPPAKGIALVLEWLRVAKSAGLLVFEAVRLSSTRKGFYKRLNSALEQPVSTLDAMPLTDLAKEYRRIEADLLDRWDAPLVNDFLCMIAFGASRKMLEKWAGLEGLELHNDIMIGQGDIVSAEPAQRIRMMGKLLDKFPELQKELSNGNGENIGNHPELAKEFAGYLDKFADRCAEELKLESITLDRDPSPLYRAIASGVGGGQSSNHSSDSDHKLNDLDTVFAGKPIKKWIAKPVMKWAKARVRDRENLRFERTRIFGRARHLFRAVGTQFTAHGMLDETDDIFLLTVQEVLGAIEGFGLTADLRTLANSRRKEFELAASKPDPDERIEVRGAIFANLKSIIPVQETTKSDDMERTGTGCSAGVIAAKAKIIRDPRTEALKKGDILVARHTDPGWIAVFANASAIVVERGSLLSHSAIVARELGIPCVVGMKSAMNWIQDGETIEVDGGSGLVRRIS